MTPKTSYTVREGNTWRYDNGVQVTVQETIVVRPESRYAPDIPVWFGDRAAPELMSARLFHKTVVNGDTTQIN